MLPTGTGHFWTSASAMDLVNEVLDLVKPL